MKKDQTPSRHNRDCPYHDFYPVILAGGSGTRFWPLSRDARPKQFLDVIEGGSLFRITVRRLLKRSSPERLFVVTRQAYRKQVLAQLRGSGVPAANVLCEPAPKNTAPAICWAAALIHKKCPGAVMGVFPSDHLIVKEKEFLRALDEAIVTSHKDVLVTFGIKPDRPETGYGYMRLGRPVTGGKNVRECRQFVEKPDLKTARRYVRGNDYYWNSGMFVWRSAVILDEFKTHLPEVYARLGREPRRVFAPDQWARLPSGSIDYGILERSDKVLTVAVKDIGWSDLGSWDALASHLKQDARGNTFKGQVVDVGSRDTMVHAGKKLIAVVGVNDLIIVDTDDALLICAKNAAQKVKDVVSLVPSK